MRKINFNKIEGNDVDILAACVQLSIEVNKFSDPVSPAEYDIDSALALSVLDEDPGLLWVWEDEAALIVECRREGETK